MVWVIIAKEGRINLMPSLYVVATPIGNLEDISLRALRILREVRLIAAEDTRRTKRILLTYDIKTPLTSYHEHNKFVKMDYILGCLESGDMALVSNAGMPVISDPGCELIAAVSQRGIPVIPIPGSSAVTTALAVSGLPAGQFIYLGFLPNKDSVRQRLLKSITSENRTIVALEAPHRLLASLNEIQLFLGDRKVAVCHELTKVHEEVFRGRVSQAIKHFYEPKGEFTLVIEGMSRGNKPKLTEEIKMRLYSMRRSGIKARGSLGKVAEETGISKKELYRAWIGR
jgi:16S rRNA (cytidine1402-2'-O)-methyltransferase